MTQTVLDNPTAQQPDTVATATAAATYTASDSALAATPQQRQSTVAATAPVHYNTVVPETLVRPHDSIFNPAPDTTQYLLMCNDSLFAPYSEQPLRQRESMFSTNTLSRPAVQPSHHTAPAASDWIFFTIVLLLTLVSIYINNQKFKLKDIFHSLFDTRVLDRVSRENNIRSVSFLPMVGIYLASIALVITHAVSASDSFVPALPSYLLFIITLAALALFLLLKNRLIHLIGNVFEDNSATMLYITSNNLFYFAGGLIAPPFLLLLFYCTAAGDATLKIAITIIAIIFIVRLFRGMQLILTNSKSAKFYLFYYLCIFETIPILITAKALLF